MTGTGPAATCVLDVGKTNVRLVAADRAGRAHEVIACANPLREGPPWRHHDIEALTLWVAEGIAALARRHPLARLVPVAHGAAGVLVGADPGAGGTGALVPMIDYEDDCPPAVAAAYAAAWGGFGECGSAIMGGTTHAARQLLRIAAERPRALAAARWWLDTPQYWAWWLAGVAASEISALAAQSHLWNLARGRFTPLVAARGWQRLVAPRRRAGDVLGPLRPALVRRHGLPPGLAVHTGAHDSSAHFHRFAAAGEGGFTLVSTGTWIVALSAEARPARLDPARGGTLGAAPDGRPLGGALTMGGRAFAALAGPGWRGEPARPATLARLVARGTFATPGFAPDDGPFPGSAGRGVILGPPPEGQEERTALALLHAAHLAQEAAAALAGGERLILDGTFLADPHFAPLVAALRPGRPTLACGDGGGVVAGAAALVAPEAAAPLLVPVAPARLPGLPEAAAAAAARARAAAG
ncbi:MAG: carbohydrate kinase [Rhodobacteraceae bacterium]|nr:carbohydrate kinase [Paracoccaceae bacterium]